MSSSTAKRLRASRMLLLRSLSVSWGSCWRVSGMVAHLHRFAAFVFDHLGARHVGDADAAYLAVVADDDLVAVPDLGVRVLDADGEDAALDAEVLDLDDVV